jgi:hypothetical protein
MQESALSRRCYQENPGSAADQILHRYSVLLIGARSGRARYVLTMALGGMSGDPATTRDDGTGT